MLGLGSSLAKGGASLLTYVKDNLKLYLDFKSNKSDTLKFPCEGSTYFSGSNQYIEIADNSDLDIAQEESFTFACWLKVEDTGANELIFSKRHSDIGYSITWHSSEKPVFYIRDSAGNNYYSYTSNALSYNTWYHYAVVWNPSTMKATHYVNGIDAGRSFENDATLVDASNSGVARIGIPADSTSYDFKGYLANMGIWKRVLSQEEINSVMRKNYSQLGSVEKTSLVMWQSLDSASDGVVTPSSGETLGSEILTTNVNTDWSAYGSNDVDTVTGGVKITHDDNAGGGSRTIAGSSGKLYKVVFNAYYSGGTAPNVKVWTGAVNSGTQALTTSSTQHTIYFVNAGTSSLYFDSVNGSQEIFITNLSAKEVTSNTGFVTGATTTTSVYGNNAPVLPRAVDVAKEGEADAIGNGSASFTASNTDYIVSSSNIGIKTSSPRTVSSWIKLDDNPSSNAMYNIFSYGTTSTHQFFEGGIYNHSGTIKAQSNVWGTDHIVAHTFTSGEWYHYTVVLTSESKLQIYVNGILLGTSSAISNVNTADGVFNIGRRNNDTGHFNGDISQVGVWAGALTQAQIQSVMESTSYAKIPADVKSTLGSSEITSASNTTFSGVTSNNWAVPADVTKSFSNDQMVFTMDDDTPAGYVAQFSSGNFAGGSGIPQKFLKVTLDIDSTTTGSYSINNAGGSCTADVFLKTPLTTGVNTIYGLCDGASSYFRIFEVDVSTGDKLVLNSFDVKEVTNDIVAFYPLDADNSANGVTNDATTGEVLGSNTFGGLNQFQPKVVDRESVSVSGDELILTIPSANDAGMHTGNLANLGLSTSLGYAVGDLVKLQFEAKIVTNGSGYGETVRWYDSNGYVFPATNISLTSEYQTFTFINEITNLSYSIPSFLRMGNRTGTDVYNLKNFSVQKITSNTGVLK